jgi:hypothetical protein
VGRKGQNGANEAIHFAKRKESFRGGQTKSLKSLRRPIQPFLRIVCFQWVKPHFVRRFVAGALPGQKVGPWPKERSLDLTIIAEFSGIDNNLLIF